MTEEEFVALLAIEGKKLIVDREMSRGNFKNGYKPVPYYRTYVADTRQEALGFFGKAYRSRAYAVQKVIKDYYENR